MPDWLVQVVIQYPIVAIVGFVAWYASRRVERALDGRVTRAEQLHDAALAHAREDRDRALAEMRTAATELKNEMADELKKLGKKVDELNRRLSP